MNNLSVCRIVDLFFISVNLLHHLFSIKYSLRRSRLMSKASNNFSQARSLCDNLRLLRITGRASYILFIIRTFSSSVIATSDPYTNPNSRITSGHVARQYKSHIFVHYVWIYCYNFCSECFLYALCLRSFKDKTSMSRSITSLSISKFLNIFHLLINR